jgi:zinc transport system ATP-binding protein
MAQAQPSPLLLRCQDLTIGHGRQPLLPPLGLEVHSQQAWALLGPNGAGKTTLLRTWLGLQPALGGQLALADHATMGYVPQRTELDPAVPGRVIDLVRSGTERGWSFLQPLHARRHTEQVQRALRDTHIAHLADEPWTHLSEGQKQRVLMAQALAGEPQLLVLDEPTSAMDLQAEQGIFALLDELRQQRQLAVVVVSHNLGLVLQHVSHAVFLDRDQAMAIAGPVAEVVQHPAFAARFGLQTMPQRQAQAHDHSHGSHHAG